jgi:hypothetical protein
MSATLARFFVCAWLLLAGVACAPKIGKDCSNALDCSSQGSRLCDRTEPGGYCTIMGCEEGTCPSEAVCVKFRPVEERLAVTYCMAKCSDRSDCRNDEGYDCTATTDFGQPDDAVILGDSRQKFCAVVKHAPSVKPGNQSYDDAGEQQDATTAP